MVPVWLLFISISASRSVTEPDTARLDEARVSAFVSLGERAQIVRSTELSAQQRRSNGGARSAVAESHDASEVASNATQSVTQSATKITFQKTTQSTPRIAAQHT